MRQNLSIKMLVLALVLSLVPIAARTARDYPHNTDNTIECLSCHYIIGGVLPQWVSIIPQNIDDTTYNNLCWDCHIDGGTANYQKTHSSRQTSDKYGDADNDGEPGWSMECKTCHMPHSQDQLHRYGSQGYLETGNSTNIIPDSPSRCVWKTGQRCIAYTKQWRQDC